MVVFPMKYWSILFAIFLMFIGFSLMAWFLWDFADNLAKQSMLVGFAVFGLLLFVRGLKIYVQVEHEGKSLRIKTFFTMNIYNLDDLTSWNEMTNLYRVSYRKLKLEFGSKKVELMDHSNRQNIEQLYHYLRTHYGELGN